jgi:hypothetical protein
VVVKLTARDHALVTDLALSHVLSRDQILALGYFNSVTRANTRLRLLRAHGFVASLETPFFHQSLYMAGSNTADVCGDWLASVLRGRSATPRFLQHALAVTNVRLSLLNRRALEWRFELPSRCECAYGGKTFQVRPDGIAVSTAGLTLIEVDCGHVAPFKFREKLLGFEAMLNSGRANAHWRASSFKVLTVTTGALRAKHLRALVPPNCSYDFRCETFSSLGITCPSGWS